MDSKDLFSLALVNKNLYRITKDFRVDAKCVLKKYLFDQVAKMALSLEMTLMPCKAYSQDRPIFSVKAPISEKSLKYLFYFSLPESHLIEIAGASGETALALAHLVKQVKINDVEEAQIQEGRELFSTLPKNIQQKIEFIAGDFFQTSFEKESVDVVICRNFINLLTVKIK